MLTAADQTRIESLTDEVLAIARRAEDRRLADRLTIAAQWLEMGADLLDHQLTALPTPIATVYPSTGPVLAALDEHAQPN